MKRSGGRKNSVMGGRLSARQSALRRRRSTGRQREQETASAPLQEKEPLGEDEIHDYDYEFADEEEIPQYPRLRPVPLKNELVDGLDEPSGPGRAERKEKIYPNLPLLIESEDVEDAIPAAKFPAKKPAKKPERSPVKPPAEEITVAAGVKARPVGAKVEAQTPPAAIVAARPVSAGWNRTFLALLGVSALLLLPAGIAALAIQNQDLRAQIRGLDADLQGLAERASAVSPPPPPPVAVEPVPVVPEKASLPGDVEVAAMMEQLADMVARLEAVEKRARLAAYADEAISSGSRFAYNQLLTAYNEPGMVSLKSSSNAEISRVESFFVATAAARYQEIPVGAVDANLTSDVELTERQLAQVILGADIPPMARARAAELLKSHRSIESCQVLMSCIKTEPNLVVLLEATRSFKALTGYPSGEVFGSRVLERWYDANRERIKEKFKAGVSQ